MSDWRKSSFCASGGCVEVDMSGDVIRVRDHARPNFVVWVDRDDWRTFVAGVKAGEFDHQPPPKAA